LLAQTNASLPTWTSDALARARSNERPVIFYGKVIDQFGVPVQGSEIQATIQQAGILYVPGPPEPRINLKTDANGQFEITGSIKGLNLIIDQISKDGFEALRPIGKDYFTYAEGSPSKHVPDKTKPVIYHLRKKLLPEVVLMKNTDFAMVVNKIWSGKPLGFDLIRQWKVEDFENPMHDYRPLYADLVMTATLNTNSGQWAVTLSMGNTNGGLMTTEQLLYEAPASGYQAEYTFTPTNSPRFGKVMRFYLKSREPALYTRLDVEAIRVSPEELRLEGTTWINPYGDRDMEEAVNLPGDLLFDLRSEAKQALRTGKRPVRPDLPKLIQEAKAKGK